MSRLAFKKDQAHLCQTPFWHLQCVRWTRRLCKGLPTSILCGKKSQRDFSFRKHLRMTLSSYVHCAINENIAGALVYYTLSLDLPSFQATLSSFAGAAVVTLGSWSSSCLASQSGPPFQLLISLGLLLPSFARPLGEISLLRAATRPLPSFILTHVTYCVRRCARCTHTRGHLCVIDIILILLRHSKFYSLLCFIANTILCSMLN